MNVKSSKGREQGMHGIIYMTLDREKNKDALKRVSKSGSLVFLQDLLQDLVSQQKNARPKEAVQR